MDQGKRQKEIGVAMIADGLDLLGVKMRSIVGAMWEELGPSVEDAQMDGLVALMCDQVSELDNLRGQARGLAHSQRRRAGQGGASQGPRGNRRPGLKPVAGGKANQAPCA